MLPVQPEENVLLACVDPLVELGCLPALNMGRIECFTDYYRLNASLRTQVELCFTETKCNFFFGCMLVNGGGDLDKLEPWFGQ